MTRFKAAATYLAYSVLLAGSVLALMLTLWYPAPFFEAMGGSKLALLIIGIDIVLGPLLVLIIFKPGKKGLALDLSILVAIQLAAWGYGNWVMFQARPAYVVYLKGVFRVTAANELDPEVRALARREEYRKLPLTGPVFVTAEMPTDPAERTALAFAAVSGIDLHLMPKYYVPYETRRADAAARGKPLTELAAAMPANEAEINKFLARTGRKADTLRAVPMLAKARELTVLVDAGSGDVVGIIPVITP